MPTITGRFAAGSQEDVERGHVEHVVRQDVAELVGEHTPLLAWAELLQKARVDDHDRIR